MLQGPSSAGERSCSWSCRRARVVAARAFPSRSGALPTRRSGPTASAACRGHRPHRVHCRTGRQRTCSGRSSLDCACTRLSHRTESCRTGADRRYAQPWGSPRRSAGTPQSYLPSIARGNRRRPAVHAPVRPRLSLPSSYLASSPTGVLYLWSGPNAQADLRAGSASKSVLYPFCDTSY
jgi:hypothetical protein